MDEYIMVGIDVHEATLVTQMAAGRGAPEKRTWSNDAEGRAALWAHLRERRGHVKAAKVVMAYEASSQGFGLYDEAGEQGFACHILAPTRLPATSKSRKHKNDGRDAGMILEVMRGHVLGGNKLPAIWVPDPETREGREVVRMRLAVGEKLTSVKAQVQMLLKRQGVRRPKGLGEGWTNGFVAWLRGLCRVEGLVGEGRKVALASLLRQKEALDEEIERLDGVVAALAQEERYAKPVEALTALKGIGVLTAMVVLTELGDLSRFRNRREIAAYLGVVPSSDESGEVTDRKGHITHQGPSRVRRALCQASWARVRYDEATRRVHERIARKNPTHKKIALVAIMRRLAILLWHLGREAQQAAGCFVLATARPPA